MNAYIKDLLTLKAANWLREDYPKLYALAQREVEAGRAKEDILKGCAKVKGVNATILNSIAMTIDHLLREV